MHASYFLPANEIRDVCTHARRQVLYMATYLFCLEGGGDLDLGFTKARDVNGINGRISGLNVWDHVIESKEIRRMSLGCANETGNAESWKSLISATSLPYSAILNQSDLSCQDREGNPCTSSSLILVCVNSRTWSLTGGQTTGSINFESY